MSVSGGPEDLASLAVDHLVAVFIRVARPGEEDRIPDGEAARQRRRRGAAEVREEAIDGALVSGEAHSHALADVVLDSVWPDDLALLAVRKFVAILKRLVRARVVQLVAGLVTARRRAGFPVGALRVASGRAKAERWIGLPSIPPRIATK